MTRLSIQGDLGARRSLWSLSRCQLSLDDHPTTVLATRQTNEYGFLDDEDHSNLLASVHFRQQLPSIFYRMRGTRLTLMCLDTDYAPTIVECGSRIIAVGLHDDSSNVLVHLLLANDKFFSMILTPAHLQNPSLARESGWISEYTPTAFQIRRPLGMCVLSATSIVISLRDGGLLRLTNTHKGYEENLFSDSTYFDSLRSMLPWSGRSPNAVISMRTSAARGRLYTLTIDGVLKTWDLKQGRLIASLPVYKAGSRPEHFEDVSAKGHMAICETGSATHLLIYHRQSGTFKFFKTRGDELIEGPELMQREPGEGLWRLFDMTVHVPENGDTQIAVLWKDDLRALVQTATYCSMGNYSWETAHQQPGGAIPELNTEQLLQHVFSEHRFSSNVVRQAIVRCMPEASSVPESPESMREYFLTHVRELSGRGDEQHGTAVVLEEDEVVSGRLIQLAKLCQELTAIAGEPHTLVRSRFTGECLVAGSETISLLAPSVAVDRVLRYDGSSWSSGDGRYEAFARALNRLHPQRAAFAWQAIAAELRESSLAAKTMGCSDAMLLTGDRLSSIDSVASVWRGLSPLFDSASSTLTLVQELVPLLRPSLKEGGESVMGLTGYYAIHDATNSTALTVAQFASFCVVCSAQGNPGAAELFADLQEQLRQLHLVRDLLTIDLPDGGLHNTKASTKGNLFCTLGDVYDYEVPYRNLIEHALVQVVNHQAGGLVQQLSKYAGLSCFAQYLVHRCEIMMGNAEQGARGMRRVAPRLVQEQATRAERFLQNRLDRSSLKAFFLHASSLCSDAGSASAALELCLAARTSSLSTASTADARGQLDDLLNTRLFEVAAGAQDYSNAFLALAELNEAARRPRLATLIKLLCEQGHAHELTSVSDPELIDEIDRELEVQALSMLDVRAPTRYHKLLSGLRMLRGQPRAAATILYQRLQALQNRSRLHGFNTADHLEITEDYLAVLTILRCMSEREAWIIVGSREWRKDGEDEPESKRQRHEGTSGEKAVNVGVVRKLLSIDDIKREYNAELRNMEAQLTMLMEDVEQL
ncbi:hypothetical protein PYCC9005_004261 [Savitreella phatthalungensis]